MIILQWQIQLYFYWKCCRLNIDFHELFIRGLFASFTLHHGLQVTKHEGWPLILPEDHFNIKTIFLDIWLLLCACKWDILLIEYPSLGNLIIVNHKYNFQLHAKALICGCNGITMPQIQLWFVKEGWVKFTFPGGKINANNSHGSPVRMGYRMPFNSSPPPPWTKWPPFCRRYYQMHFH